MRQLDTDSASESAPASQARRLRREIGRYRRRLAQIDHPETVRVFEMLINDVQTQLERTKERKERVQPTDSAMPPTREGNGHE
jgi:hypothetical protein